MNFLSNPVAARLLWVLPLIPLAVAVFLLPRGFEQRETAEAGVPVDAAVTAIEVRERSEITHGMVRLRYLPPAAQDSVERWVELPLAFMKEIEGLYAADPDLFLNNFKRNMAVVRKNRRTAEQFLNEMDGDEAHAEARRNLETMRAFYTLMESFYTDFAERWESETARLGSRE